MSSFHEISAVHDKELEGLLKSLNLLDEVNEGRVSCRFCGTTITLENLQCIYPKDDEIVFCCEKIKCFEQAVTDAEGGKTSEP